MSSFAPYPSCLPAQPCLHRTRIKICGLTRECDVDAAVAAGADALGFVLYERSARYVSPERARELARRLPPFVTPVLLLVNASAELVRAAVQAVPQATLQFHGDESPADCLASAAIVPGQTRPWLRAARIPVHLSGGGQGPAFDLAGYARRFAAASAILLDAHVSGYGGAGQSFDWAALAASIPGGRLDAHLVLSGGLDAGNVARGLRILRGCGLSLAVDVSTGVEARNGDGSPRRGEKDAQAIAAFIAAVRVADLAEGLHRTPSWGCTPCVR